MPNLEQEALIWADERKNYVQRINTIRLRLKNAANVGRDNRGCLKSGNLFPITLRKLSVFKPKIVDIDHDTSAVSAFDQLIKHVDSETLTLYVSELFYLKIFETCDFSVDSLCDLTRRAQKLTVFEMNSTKNSEELVDRKFLFSRLIDELKKKTKLKAVTFNCKMTCDQFDQWIDALKLNIRIVTFNGQFEMDVLMKCRNELPCVEFLALQSFSRRIRDDEGDFDGSIYVRHARQIFCCWGPQTFHRGGGENRPPLIKEENFFRRIEFMFCNLKILFFDWNVIDTVCIFDDRTSRICSSIRNMHKRLKMQFVAILIYTPDSETKTSVQKMIEHFEKETEPDGVKVRHVQFSVIPSTPENFSLIVFGDYHYQARTKRLIEVVTQKRVTSPTLDHFCYVVDVDNYSNVDLSIDFAGFESQNIKRVFEEVCQMKDPNCADRCAKSIAESAID
uniref:Uncharacterized protein n=1 Tax=Romanomermis culicivorax TaxID=13658 RepID=A0A915K6A5_ROMCU